MFKNCQEGGRNSDRYRYASLQSCYIYQPEEGAFLPCWIWEKQFYYVCIGEGKGYLTVWMFCLKIVAVLIEVCRTTVAHYNICKWISACKLDLSTYTCLWHQQPYICFDVTHIQAKIRLFFLKYSLGFHSCNVNAFIRAKQNIKPSKENSV